MISEVEAKFIVVPVDHFTEDIRGEFGQFNSDFIMECAIKVNDLLQKEINSGVGLESDLPILDIITRAIRLGSFPAGFDHRRSHI